MLKTIPVEQSIGMVLPHDITEIVRDAVKRFRQDWGDMEAARNFMPMGPMMGMRMPRMMMRYMMSDDTRHQYEKRD
jgi:hypothetical protein